MPTDIDIKEYILINFQEFMDSENVRDLDYINFLDDKVELSFRKEATIHEYSYKGIIEKNNLENKIG